MHINNNLYSSDALLNTATRLTAKTATVSANGAAGEIRLSELSNRLHSIESKLSSAPAFDSARVEQIKAAIRDGSYTVNPDAVADKVIQDVRELLGVQSD